MKKETIREYTILFQYLLILKEPTYIFLIQVLQHLSPSTWWEDFIVPVLQRERKENFKYLDMSDLLNVFKMNLNRIVKYRNQKGYQLHYNAAYKTVNRAHWIRTIVAHANDIDMSPSVFIDSLACLLDFSRLIGADGNLIVKLENDWRKYLATLPQEKAQPSKETMIKEKILSKIETRIILKAVNCDSLPADIKLSIDRTMLRLHSMRTLEEIVGFFNNAMRSERGKVVQNVLYNNGLLSFEDIKDEINLIYAEMLETED